MKKRLFHEVYETYTTDANTIDSELTHILRPLIEKYSQEYSMNDLELVFLNAVGMTFCEYKMVRNIEIKKESKNV